MPRRGQKMTDEAKCKIAEASRQRWANPAYREMVSKRISESRSNPSDEYRRHLSEALRLTYSLHPELGKAVSERNLGRTFSIETKEKMRAAKIGKPLKPEHAEKIRQALKGRIFSAEHRAKITAANTGRKHSSASLEKMRTWRAGLIMPYKNSFPERCIHEALRRFNAKFEQHREIEGFRLASGSRHQFDFLIHKDKVAIEVDGCYWHGCPICFPSPNASQKKTIARDKEINVRASEMGWKVLRIWEHEIAWGYTTRLIHQLGLCCPREKAS